MLLYSEKHKEVFMQVFNRVLGRLKKVGVKKLAGASAFMLAMTAAVGLGIASKQHTSAATAVTRDCSVNSIDYKDLNGGCGAVTPQEYIADLRSNSPSDLQALAANFQGNFNLQPSQYDDFAAHAVDGIAYKNGDVKVSGQTVLTNIWTIGRSSKSYSWLVTPPNDGGNKYYGSKSTDVFAVDQIPVIVYFNNDGTAQYVIEKPCGNLVGGTKVTPSYACNTLNKSAVSGEKDTYSFTTNAVATNNAVITKYVYDFGDGSSATTNSANEAVRHTYAKAGTYTATVHVYVSLPGGHSTITQVGGCKTTITVVAPYYACTGLSATTLDTSNQKFRFTAKSNFGNGATLASANFTVDGNTVKGITTKDAKGNFYNEYNFTDGQQHSASAVINFTVDGKIVSSTQNCSTSVTSKQTPMCTVPGKEKYLPNALECQQECKPGIPVGSPACNTIVLTNTGAGNVVGLFAGTSAFGAAVHSAIAVRRGRKGKHAAATARESVDVSKYL
jgi:hypothetical protein